MELYATGSHVLASADAARQAAKAPSSWPAILVVLSAAVAVAIQSLWIPVDADVSWLITVNERVLAGDRLYVDLFEVNPPASVWLYLPLVWLAQVVGIKPEAIVVAAFVVAGLASVSATVRLASVLDDVPDTRWLAPALASIALVLPMALFAQREHAALLLALPALTALAVLGRGGSLDRRAIYASGIAAGLIVVIKPYFLPAVLAPAAWAAWNRRRLAPLLPGIGAAAAVVGLYSAAVLIFANAYLDWLPVIAETYSPMRKAAWKVALGPSLYPAVCMLLAILLRPPRIPSLAVVWALGSAGFVVAAMIQGKNYPNHWLPGAALALASTFVILTLPRIQPALRALIGVALSFVAVYEMKGWAIRPDPAVAQAIARAAPPSPTIIALSPQLTTGHPVTRNVGGQWVGSRAGLYTATGALYVGLKSPIARQAYRDDIQAFATDVRRHAPDVVLVDRASRDWLIGEKTIAEVMSAYRRAEVTTETEIWLRRSEP